MISNAMLFPPLILYAAVISLPSGSLAPPLILNLSVLIMPFGCTVSMVSIGGLFGTT
ncbi:hypothetical protein D3C79_1054460 [compost metagenome]